MVRLHKVLFWSVASLSLTRGGELAYAEDGTKGAFSPTINDYGTTGLVQMPSGRMSPDGSFYFGFSTASPYTRFYLTTQFLPWLQGTFRYTDISYASYGIVDTQSFKDKSVDFKIRLIEENKDFPELSVGFRDIGGTGIFSSEYVALSRRYYSFDFTGGVAWGNMGSRGHLPNPLGYVLDSAKVRSTSETTGTLSTSFFRGEKIGVFGGVEWQTPLDGLHLKLEYDSNNYQKEYLDNALEVTSPFNVAGSYRVLPWVDLSLGYERGNTVMFRGTLLSNFNTDYGVPDLDAVAPLPLDNAPDLAVKQPGVSAQGAAVAAATAQTIDGSLRDASVDTLFDTMNDHAIVPSSIDLGSDVVTIQLDKASRVDEKDLAAVSLAIAQMPTIGGIQRVVFRDSTGKVRADHSTSEILQKGSLYGAIPDRSVQPTQQDMAKRFFGALDYYDFKGRLFSVKENRATVVYSQSLYRKIPVAFGRVARALVLSTPPSVTEFDIIEESAGVPIARVVMHRSDVLKAAMGTGSVDELWLNSQTPAAALPADQQWVENDSLFPTLSWGLAPHLRQNVGGPNNFYLYQIYAKPTAQITLRPNLWVSGALGVNLTNNFANFTYDAPSNLPRVRTDIRKYLIDKDYWIDDLSATYVTSLGPNWYGRVSAGIFELMYGGVDGEILYRPAGKRWALGLDVNHVWQRDYEGLLGFKDYDVTTGALTWYQTLPYKGMDASLSIGRYLAKDVGATVRIGRVFENGMKIGAWATKTNVSAAEFGEGAFDKGFYVTIPFDLFSLKPTKSSGSIAFRPLTRDGGATVGLPGELYYMTGTGGQSTSGWQDTMK